MVKEGQETLLRMMDQEETLAMRRCGMEEVGSPGEAVDYETCEVLDIWESEDEGQAGIIAHVYCSGRIYQGKTFAKAQVAAYGKKTERGGDDVKELLKQIRQVTARGGENEWERGVWAAYENMAMGIAVEEDKRLSELIKRGYGAFMTEDGDSRSLRERLQKEYDRLDAYIGGGYYYKEHPERRRSKGVPKWESESDGTYVRTERKIGRNDPCPCGSGKKYKKCRGR